MSLASLFDEKLDCSLNRSAFQSKAYLIAGLSEGHIQFSPPKEKKLEKSFQHILLKPTYNMLASVHHGNSVLI